MLGVYPQLMDFFHIVPVAPGRSKLRRGTYARSKQIHMNMKRSRVLSLGSRGLEHLDDHRLD